MMIPYKKIEVDTYDYFNKHKKCKLIYTTVKEENSYQDPLYPNINLSELKEKLINKNSIDLKTIKTISIESTCILPRHKLKKFCNKYNITLIKDYTKSDIHFINDKILDNIINVNYFNRIIDLKEMNNYLKKEKINITVNDSNNPILINIHNYIKNGNSITKSYVYSEIKDEDKLDYLMNNIDKIRDYSILTTLCNEDTITLDEKSFNELSALFNGQEEDVIVAMEIMANCNYDVSISWLLKLWSDNSYAIKNSKTRNHVNFKSLTKYMVCPVYRGIELEDMISILKEKNLLTKTNIDILIPNIDHGR